MTSNFSLSTKVAIVGLGLMTALAFSGAIIATPVAHGQTVEDLQAQIADLLAQIQALQEQLAGTPTTTPGFVQCDFTRNLTVGSVGEDVRCLQRYLNTSAEPHGYLQVVADSGPGSSGMETTYFGSLTKAAVIAWQNVHSAAVLAPVGINTGTGFWGPSSRAHYNVLKAAAAAAPTPSPTDPTDPTDPTPTDPTDVGLHVKFADNNPVAGNILREGVEHLMVAYDLTAVGQNVTVDHFTLTRRGFVADEYVEEMYLYVNGELVSDFYTNTATRLFRLDGPFTINSGQTALVEVYADINNSVNVGTELWFNLEATDHISHNATAVHGTFPLISSAMRAASANLATTTVTLNSLNDVDLEVGVSDEVFADFTVEVLTNDVMIKHMVFEVVGTFSVGDITNFSLVDEDEDVVATASMGTDKKVRFTNLNLELEAGTYDFEIRGDVKGGVGRTFTFTIDRESDVYAMDMEFDVRSPVVLVQTASTREITIEPGDLTIERRADSPVGDISLGSDGVVLAKYDFTAGGERTRISSIVLGFASSSAEAGTLRNVKVLVDGVQKGSTQSSLAIGAAAVTFSFGNTFTIELGDTHVVSIVADVKVDDVDAGAIFNVDGGAISGTFLGSNNSITGETLPNGRLVRAVEGILTFDISDDTPDGKVLSMGRTYEVARWDVEAENEDMRLRQILFTHAGGVLERNVDVVTLKLYENGTLVGQRVRTVPSGATSTIWFGNSSNQGPWTNETRLDWDVKDGKDYELVLEFKIAEHVDFAAEGAVSGATSTVTLEEYDYRKLGVGTNVLGATTTEAGETHEIYYTTVTVTGEDPDVNRTVDPFDGQTVLNFSVQAGTAGNVRLASTTFTISGTASTTGGVWEVRRGTQVIATSTIDAGSVNAQTIVFDFTDFAAHGANSSDVTISAGSSVNFTVRADLTGAGATSQETIRVNIANGSHFIWSAYDGNTLVESGISTSLIEDFPVESRRNVIPDQS